MKLRATSTKKPRALLNTRSQFRGRLCAMYNACLSSFRGSGPGTGYREAPAPPSSGFSLCRLLRQKVGSPRGEYFRCRPKKSGIHWKPAIRHGRPSTPSEGILLRTSEQVRKIRIGSPKVFLIECHNSVNVILYRNMHYQRVVSHTAPNTQFGQMSDDGDIILDG
jgi:hypothetical protein